MYMDSRISKLSGMLRQKKISALELTEEYLKKIEERNPELNAYVRLCYDKAREDAKKADVLLSRNEGGILCGIPFALKDNICTKDIETGCCSQVLEKHKPLYDAAVVEKLKEQGEIV
jgi:aspartyl-tRNA(Asn)/glutamyl-tRNA(Gln) amidotransferase subunit A